MIHVHVLWHWGARETWTTPIGEAISMAAGPTAAPVFMFLVGASLGAAPRTRFGTLAARGLVAWSSLGYVLNLLRGVIPANLGLATGVITAEQVDPYTTWWLATTVDLHHVVGLSLVVIALLRARVQPGWLWLAIAGVLVLVAPWLRTVSFGTPLLDAPLTPFLGAAPNVYYAVVPWLLSPGRRGLRRDDRAVQGSRGSLPTRRAGRCGAPGIGGVAHRRPAAGLRRLHLLAHAALVRRRDLRDHPALAGDVRPRDPAATDRRPPSGSCTAGATASSPSTSRTGSSSAGASASSGSGRFPLEAVLLAMVAAVVATSYLSRFAVRLESSWWQRTGRTREESEVAVVVRAA